MWIDLFNPILQTVSVNNSYFSAQLNWIFDPKSVKFNKFSIIYKINDSNEEMYFIPKGNLNLNFWFSLNWFFVFVENIKYSQSNININEERVQLCYKSCFESSSCYYLSLLGGNCSLHNNSTLFNNCKNNEICVSMNSNYISNLYFISFLYLLPVICETR